MKKKIRLSFDLPPEAKVLMEDLQERSNASTLTEVFRKALAIYDLFLEQNELNGKIIFESAEGKQETLRLV
ncbi:hypothetical protein [Luteolibacter luteus]|uniref:Ribbon-helix-helix protein CopG domain-containing protein n=1 Tax=Luteolibacter luteus TaxID=2728835 RepID=A0A858RQ76_9BACT|nr:hypothetical protein [Luteolibacter luteus]QJE98885.1 hypothetical protein HHL09_24925 [Luteolibacter luteus]